MAQVPGVATFRLCKLNDEQLLDKIGQQMAEMYETGEVPTRHVPARPDSDFDLLVGELILRYHDLINPEAETSTK